MDYDEIGSGYARHRRPDPRIAARLDGALGDARSVVNVGAGAGSYEPNDRSVVAVEPSAKMIEQRPVGSASVIQARAEGLPFPDRSFDAAMAVLTVHHWSSWRRGLAELRRVARRRVVILTWDPEVCAGHWFYDYLPGMQEPDADRFPSPAQMAEALGGARVEVVPIPHDCTDGFLGAYWRRPRAFLDPSVRRAISAFARPFDGLEEGLARLGEDLELGRWDERWGHLRAELEHDMGYRIVVAEVVAEVAS